MLKSVTGLFACGLVATVALGQPTAEWLHSLDPRIQAWGAYAVLRDQRTEAVLNLLAMVARFRIVDPVATQSGADQHNAMLGVLDALIQLGAEVPAGDAQRIYPEFPVQALILLSRSREDTTPALLDIFKSERRWPSAWLAAGALLVERRADGFAAAVVDGMTVDAVVRVTNPGAIPGGGGGSAICCGGGRAGPRAGWPPLGVYAFGCAGRVQAGATLLAGGTDPAFYHRQVTSSYQVEGISGCACQPDLDPVREHYLTTLLPDSSEQPPVRAHVSHTIEWQSPDAYRDELAAFISHQQEIFAALGRKLGDQTVRPRLRIRIQDFRTLKQPVLPEVETVEQNIMVAPPQ